VDDLKKKRFLWGILFAWLPWAPALIGLGYALKGMSTGRATGLAAVASGFTEMFVVWGVASVLIAEVAAVIFLSRAISTGHWIRGLVSIVSIAVSCLMLFLLGLFLLGGFLGWSFFQAHPAP